MASSDIEVNFQDVQEAAKRIAPYIHKTPVMTCSTLDSLAGRTLHFKCELFQKVGAFKVSDENIVCHLFLLQVTNIVQIHSFTWEY